MLPLQYGWFDRQGLLMGPAFYLAIALLHFFLPSIKTKGYCCDSNTRKVLEYNLNGLVVLVIMLQLYFMFYKTYGTYAYERYNSALLASNILGIFLSLVSFFAGGNEKYTRCLTVDQLGDKCKLVIAGPKPSALSRFYLGQRWNPRILGVDFKMLLYTLGACMLEMIVVSSTRAHVLYHQGKISNAMLCYAICMSWFVFDYMLGEYVHLFTYDLFAEKLGFKLIWGCLVFYPFFYCIGIFPLVKAPLHTDISQPVAIAIGIFFLFGWSITRGANLQKFFFRINPSQKTFLFGLIPQRTIPGTRILCSGFWGLARHFNYVGEILQAVALAIPGVLVGQTLGAKLMPLLYPLYYLLLFIPRQFDDDAVCKAKYGVFWDEYQKEVPYRIFPGIW